MAAFHYIVKVRIIRGKKNGEIDFVEDEKEFRNENPIEARDAAFGYYQNYIDVFLQANGKVYESHKQAEEELYHFWECGTKTKIKINESEFEFDNSWENGIGVFFVIDEPKYSDEKPGEFSFIHGIGGDWFGNRGYESLMLYLEEEYEYYKHYNYSTNNKEIDVLFADLNEVAEGYLGNGQWVESYSEPNWHKILETPFDWTGLDAVPEPEELEDKTQQISKTIEDYIENGESNQVEFKPALLYNFKTKQAGIGVKYTIAKTICAFLNSNGGFLFIGINDDGISQGLDSDFSLSEGKKPKDFFRLEFDQTLEYFLSFSVKNLVSGEFYTYQGKEIFKILVMPSKNRPVFLKGQEGKEFYVRGEASSRQIKDIEQLVNYCIDRWGNNG